MVVFCPGCGSRISVEPAEPGGEVTCPRCHSTFPTAGVRSAADAPPPKRFKPKKKGGSKTAGVLIGLISLLVLAGGTVAALYVTGVIHFGGAGPSSGGGTTAGTTKPLNWQEYVAPDGDFRVMLPGTPTRDTIPPPSKLKPGQTPRVVSFTVETPDAAYSVAYEDYSTPAAAEQFVEKQRAELSAGHGGKLVSEKDVTAGPHKGKEFVVEVPNRGTASMRFVTAGRRLYKVMVVGMRRAPDPGDVAKVFDSFRITG